MGVMYDYFAAPSDEVAASMIDGGPVAAGHRAVETKWLDPAVMMGQLEELLTGRPYDEVVADPRSAANLAFEADGEVLVLTVTDGLRDGLANAGELAEVAAAWAGIEELRGFDPAGLAVVPRELKELAVEAVKAGERLCCWVCV